jgi:hypothetical protein
MKANKALTAERNNFCRLLLNKTKNDAIKIIENNGYSYAVYTRQQYARCNFVRNVTLQTRVNIILESNMVDIFVTDAFFG